MFDVIYNQMIVKQIVKQNKITLILNLIIMEYMEKIKYTLFCIAQNNI